MDERVYWLWLTIAFGPANPRIWQVRDRFSSAEECCRSLMSGGISGLTTEEWSAIKSAGLSQAQRILDYCENKGIIVVDFDSREYPELLRNIYNPPAVLFSLGTLSFLEEAVTVGVVGARNMTDYTEKVTRAISGRLAESGITIVSGFANGVDSAAHTAAIEAGGKTVAVLGCGVEYDYPKDTGKMKRLIAQNGAVLSEYFPTAAPNSLSFRARNRILSGISRGVLITQASKSSGALNTASYAVSQGKDLFCIPPHDIFSPLYSGVASLLSDGATPVFSHRDILYEYYGEFSHKLRFTKDLDAFAEKSESSLLFASDIPAEATKKSRTKHRAGSSDVKNREEPEHTGNSEKLSLEKPSLEKLCGLSGLKSQIADKLKQSPMAADELADLLNTDVSELLTELTEMEIEGIVESMAGNRFKLAGG